MKKKPNKDFKNTINYVYGIMIPFMTIKILSEALSGLSDFSLLSWNDVKEHRYEILDQLLAEKYFLM